MYIYNKFSSVALGPISRVPKGVLCIGSNARMPRVFTHGSQHNPRTMPWVRQARMDLKGGSKHTTSNQDS